MYTPDPFVLADLVSCQEIISSNGFGELVTVDPDGLPTATHLPFLLEAGRGPRGTLVGHLARANPQVARLAEGKTVLAIFRGPHTYVSPAWYNTKPSVPTWNYIAIHAYGVSSLIEAPARVRGALARLVAANEVSVGSTWKMNSLDESYIAEMTERIVTFEVRIDRLEGKAKLSQNRSEADRAGVIAALEVSSDPSARDVARAMKAWGSTTEVDPFQP
jgi:transcriptional regulator